MKILFATLFLSLTVASSCCVADQASDFKIQARNSLIHLFKQDNEKQVVIHAGSRPEKFFLYTADINARSPIITTRCNLSTRFSITVNGNTASGRESLGILKLGLCRTGTELAQETISKQKEMHAYLIPHFKSFITKLGLQGAENYQVKKITPVVSLHSFYVLAFGHGALMSPTAVMTSAKNKYTVLMQFELPPRCNTVKNSKLTFCSSIGTAFEKIGLSLLPGNDM